MVIIGSIIPLIGKTHLAFRLSGPLPRTYVSPPFSLTGLGLWGLYDIFNFALVMGPPSIRPDLSSEDEVVKRKLVKGAPRAYSVLIRSDILGPSDSKSS